MNSEQRLPRLFIWLKEIYEKFEKERNIASSGATSAGGVSNENK